MPIPIPSSVALVSARDSDPFAQAHMAAAAYLARYGGRTLETYRYDLRSTLFALKVRPRSVSEARAVRIAQQELDLLVTFPIRRPAVGLTRLGVHEEFGP